MRPFVEEADGLLNMRFDMATVQSAMRLNAPWALELEYTRTMMRCLLFNAAPKSILMIGLGGGSLAKYCRRTLPQTEVTAVEINPHVIALRERFQVPPDGPLFRVVQGDGAERVQASVDAGTQHDVVLVDAFHFDGLAPKLASRAFFKACRTLLSKRGVLVMNLDGDPEACQPVLGQIGDVFDGAVWSVPTDASSNRIAFAADAEHLMATMRQADARLAALSAVHRETLTQRLADRLNFAPLFG